MPPPAPRDLVCRPERRPPQPPPGGGWPSRASPGDVPRAERGAQVVAVHPGDGVDADFLGTSFLAFAVELAAAEPFEIHLPDHAEGPPRALGLALRGPAQRGHLGG